MSKSVTSPNTPVTSTKRWKQRPPGSTWGDFGADDQRGRLNLITPEAVRRGAAEIQEGLSFCLSLPLDLPGGNVLNPRRYPPVLRPTVRNGRPNMNYHLRIENPLHTDIVSDDLAILHLQYSTQWDSLAHIGQTYDINGDGCPVPTYYNGFRPKVDILGPDAVADAGIEGSSICRSTSGARALGVENMAVHCVQGRAVMVDLQAHFGQGRTLIGYDELMSVLDADQVCVEQGDMVCLHTGFAQWLIDIGGHPDAATAERVGAVLNGRDGKLLQWITDSGLAALIADNYAVEAHPAVHQAVECCAALPLHEHCLFKLGVNLGELWSLSPLALWLREHKRYRFFLTAPPLRLPGAVGSPVTPVGTV